MILPHDYFVLRADPRRIPFNEVSYLRRRRTIGKLEQSRSACLYCNT
jgi:hypothetical protein